MPPTTPAISPARRVAFEALRRIEAGSLSDITLIDLARPLDSRDAGLAYDIVYGVLRHQAQLDSLIEHFARRRDLVLDDPTLLVLRMGIYQLRYLSRIPPHAAVMESVELVKPYNGKATALVNAILRRVHRREIRFPDLATELSLPDWLVDRWLARYGEAATRGIAQAFLQPPEEHNRGMDEGARTIVPLLDAQPGQSFLDLCASPGNKTRMAIAAGVRAIACDRSFKRLLRLRDLAVPLVHLDAAQPLPFRQGFDRILADVPCSGTGTLGRNPEIRWRLTPDDVLRQQERQIAILRQAYSHLAPGGRLVYATCSLEKEENEDVVSAALPDLPVQIHQRIPGTHPGDGFFAAVFNKPA
jgi:16S rRNA (cytosine967-C5)-methyltransferase